MRRNCQHDVLQEGYSLTISIKKVLLCKNYKYELKAGKHGDIT